MVSRDLLWLLHLNLSAVQLSAQAEALVEQQAWAVKPVVEESEEPIVVMIAGIVVLVVLEMQPVQQVGWQP